MKRPRDESRASSFDQTGWMVAELEERWPVLSPHRRAHSQRVADLAVELAVRHGLAPGPAWQAGRYHDLAREWGRPALLAEAERLGWPVDVYERAEPILLHGPVVSLWARRLGMEPDVVEAMCWHTTAAPGLKALGRIIFIADGVEPGRRYAEAAALRDLARRDLAQAYDAVLLATVRYLGERGLAVHPRTQGALAERALRWTDPAPDG